MVLSFYGFPMSTGMVLCGEDDEKYYFYDSWENHGLTGWEKPLVIRRHKAQMNMAVGIREQKCKK